MRRRVNKGVRTVLHSMKAPLMVHHLPRIGAVVTSRAEDREEEEFENAPLICSRSTGESIIALEQEVNSLKRKLCIEQNVHTVLERVLNGYESPNALPPPDIPPQISDLVAEVASLEEEVVQLENLLLQLREEMYQEAVLTSAFTKKHKCFASDRPIDVKDNKGLNPEKNPEHKSETPECTSNQHSLAQLMNSNNTPESTNDKHSLAQLMDSSQSADYCDYDQESAHENMVQDDQRSHKISLLPETSDLRQPLILNSSKMGSPPLARSLLRKNMWNRRSSTMSEVRQLTKESQKAADDKPLSKHASLIPDDTRIIDETGSSPNEISENILKCLLNIFSARATSSKSNDNEDTSQLMMPPHTGPEMVDDPYGVFVGCRRSPIGPYAHFLSIDKQSFNQDLNPSSSSLQHTLKILLRKLAFADLRGLTHQMKVAFWINVYNS